jgi:purine-binding chemotaxis protein CheW
MNAAPSRPAPTPRLPVDWASVHARATALTAAEKSAVSAESILRRRARELARPIAVGQTLSVQAECICFRLGAETYAVASEYAREVHPLRGLVPLPGVPPFVRGLINLRSQIHPVVDLLRLWGQGEEGDGRHVLLVECNGIYFGLLASEIVGVRPLATASLRPLESASAKLNSQHVKGVAPDFILLDLPGLLPDVTVNETS